MEVTSAARTPEVEACRTRLASRGERLVRAFDYQIALQTVSLKGGDKPAPFSLDR